MALGDEFVGAQKYAFFVDETDWGTLPNGPGYIAFPVDDYSVEMNPESRQSKPYIGLDALKHNTVFRAMPGGGIGLPLYGWKPQGSSVSGMQYFLDWGFGDHGIFNGLASKVCEWAEGPDIANKRHLGLRVNSATITGSDDQDQISIALDVQGKDEVGNDVMTTAQAVPDDRNLLVYAPFAKCEFSLATAPVLLKSFSVQIQRALKVHYLNSRRPSLLVGTGRIVTVEFVPVKNDDTYDAYNRAVGMTEFEGQIVIKGLHNGTGATGDYTVATIDFPRLSFQATKTQGGRDDVQFNNMKMFALKPDTSDHDMDISYTEE